MALFCESVEMRFGNAIDEFMGAVELKPAADAGGPVVILSRIGDGVGKKGAMNILVADALDLELATKQDLEKVGIFGTDRTQSTMPFAIDENGLTDRIQHAMGRLGVTDNRQSI